MALAVFDNGVTVQCEVARTPAELSRGLMCRAKLAPNAGMLFVYPADGYWRAWMRNTYIPLDMIFINQNMQVVDVIANAQPLSEDLIESTAPARYMLEVNGGAARRWGVGPWTRVRLIG